MKVFKEILGGLAVGLTLSVAIVVIGFDVPGNLKKAAEAKETQAVRHQSESDDPEPQQTLEDIMNDIAACADEFLASVSTVKEELVTAAMEVYHPMLMEAIRAHRVSSGIGAPLNGMAQAAQQAAEQRAEEEKAQVAAAERKEKERRETPPAGVPEKYWKLAVKYETKAIPANVLCAVMKVESDYNPKCVTGVCYGLMQLHSKYEFGYLEGKHWSDPEANVKAGAAVLNSLWKKYGKLDKVLMVYNEGWSGDRDGDSRYSRKVKKWADIYKD